MMQSEKIDLLIAALIEAQPSLEHAKKNSKNPHFRSDYANLESVIDSVNQALPQHGLTILQPIDVIPGVGPVVVTILAHKSGQFIKSHTPIINTKNDAQGMGSAITYSRRYGQSAMVNISQTDDDGNTASAKAPARKVDKAPAKGAAPKAEPETKDDNKLPEEEF